jgi:hypothetical protein
MPRILLLGRTPALLHVLANILSVRGNCVRIALDEIEARDGLTNHDPSLVIWDQDTGDDLLDPDRFGYFGPVLVLAPRPGVYPEARPQRRVLAKPVGVEQLLMSVVDLTS